MSNLIRQENLFAAEDWRVIYQTLRNADFKSYDFDNLRQSMLDYIQLNYPEDFNDYVQSSEFVALIDLISFLGQNLSFRTDLNTRENFIETAEKRESLLRLARQLSYQPSRSLNATGLLKVKSVRISETILDPLGNDISGQEIEWSQTNNVTIYEQFVLAINSALSTTNKFGTPVKRELINNVPTELYSLSGDPNGNSVSTKFSAVVNGSGSGFEIVNPDINTDGLIDELEPNPLNAMRLIYRNDGAGNISPDTGFFFLFKQGQLAQYDFSISQQIENRVIDIDTGNITENDVWVQTVDNEGNVIDSWSRVPAVEGNNIIFNSVLLNKRKIFSVITRTGDQISVKFADGRFGDSPNGNIRIWARSGNGQSYSIKPQDMQDIVLTFRYTGRNGQPNTITFVCDLEYTVTNAVAAEGTETIRRNAPAYYFTQDRMVTGQDYAVYPPAIVAGISKIKSVNRTHSGHSRYIDINDPTGTYNDIDLFGSDGYIYAEDIVSEETVLYPSNYRIKDIIREFIESRIIDPEIYNFYLNKFSAVSFTSLTNPAVFNQVTSNANSCTGYFTIGSNIEKVGSTATTLLSNLRIGSLIEFADTNGNNKMWAPVSYISGNGQGISDIYGVPTGKRANGEGTIVFSKKIPNGYKIVRIIPVLSKTFTSAFKTTITAQMHLKNEFGIAYNKSTATWRFINADNIDVVSDFSLTYAGDATNTNRDASWLFYVRYQNGNFIIVRRGRRYVIGSERRVRFFNQNFIRNWSADVNSQDNLKLERDQILFINNTTPDGSALLTAVTNFNLIKYYTYEDGYTDPSKVIATLGDFNTDYSPDNPYTFEDLVGTNTIDFKEETLDDEQYLTLVEDGEEVLEPITKVGRKSLNFRWHHIAAREQRIDPSVSNVIDIFVLQENYFNLFKEWLANGAVTYDKPKEPTSTQLRLDMSLIEPNKTSSDSIVYHPAKFKILFGPSADGVLQAKFKVVKLAGTTVSDNDIRTKVIQSIDKFFDINNWDFGETFYFTELAAYIHRQLAGIISSVVLVPIQAGSKFGQLFQVPSESDELFISGATVNDVEIINSITQANIRIGS